MQKIGAKLLQKDSRYWVGDNLTPNIGEIQLPQDSMAQIPKDLFFSSEHSDYFTWEALDQIVLFNCHHNIMFHFFSFLSLQPWISKPNLRQVSRNSYM